MEPPRNEDRILELTLELEAANRDLLTEKMHSRRAEERFIILENEIRLAFDILSNLSKAHKERLSRICEIFHGNVISSPPGTNILQQSCELETAIQNATQEVTENQQLKTAHTHSLLASSSSEATGSTQATQNFRNFIEDQNYMSLSPKKNRQPAWSPSLPSRLNLNNREEAPRDDRVYPNVEDRWTLEDIHFAREPVTIADDIQIHEHEVENDHIQETDMDFAKRNSCMSRPDDTMHQEEDIDLSTMNLNKSRQSRIREKDIIRQEIKKYSALNPRKWVDDCCDELRSTHNIVVGSSYLSTLKFREL